MNPSLQLKLEYTLQQFSWIMRPLPLHSRSTAVTATEAEHAWLDTHDCFTQMNIFTVISEETRPPCALYAHTWNIHHMTFTLLERMPSWLHRSQITRYCCCFICLFVFRFWLLFSMFEFFILVGCLIECNFRIKICSYIGYAYNIKTSVYF